ncbi:MAG: choice-of-anchor D domain-containing protein [Vicinamibacterales bacterium]
MRSNPFTRQLALSASAFVLATLAPSLATEAATCTWAGGAGSYTTAAQWSCGVQPGAADSVFVTAGGSVVSVNGVSAFAGTLSLGSGNQFNISNGSNFFVGGAVINNGLINIRNASQLFGNGAPVAFTGTGTIVLDNSVNFAQISGSGQQFTFGSGQTLRGSGGLGVNNTFITNAGLVSADSALRTISVDAQGGSGGAAGGGVGTGGNAGLFNTGTMQATGGGNLQFESGFYENSALGVIQALAGSTVTLNNDSRIVGGTLTSVGTGVINAHGASQYLTNVTLAAGSNLDQNNDNLYLNTSFVNNGTLKIANASQLINELGSGGALTISGTGTIVLDNSTNFAYINGNGGKIIFGSNQSITGSGSLGINNTYIVNNNLFSATGGGAISIDAAGGSAGVGGAGVGTGNNAGLLNNNIIQATGASSISFASGLYENAAGSVIRAVGGSVINLNSDSRILNGTLTSDATSVINAHGASQYLNNVTLSAGSNLDQNNDNLYLNTSFVNNGTLKIANASQLINELGSGGALTISGTGTIVLDNSTNFAYINGNGGKIIFGSNQSITGSGSIGVNNTYIVNNNIFSASGGGAISIDAAGGSGGVAGAGVGTGNNSGLLNNNIIEATGGSTISFESGLYENAAGGVMRAVGGSTINLNSDSRIVNGALTSDATSVINAHNASQYLNNVTLSAGSNLDQNNDNLYLNTSFVNNGTLKIANASQLFNELGSGGALTISGTGTIVLDNSVNFAYINGNGGQDIFGAGLTIRGSGGVGVNNTVMINNGLISADAGTGISIDATGGNSGLAVGGVGTGSHSGMLNNATLQATNGRTLAFESGLYENAGLGLIRAINGSVVSLNNDSRILNGTLTSDATSVINAHGVSQYLTNVTLSAGSNLDQNNDNLYLNTSFINNGTLKIANASQLFNELGGGGALTIGGTGTIVLDNSVNFAHINGSGGQDIFGAGLTIRGRGNVGVNNTIMTNNGLISADVAGGGISIDAMAGSGGIAGGVGTGGISGLLNTGTIQAANGGTLSFESGRYENTVTGSLAALGAGSTLLMNNDANLTNLQAGGVLNLGNYTSSTVGGASTLNLRGSGANSISTIGNVSASQDTVVTLSGVNSVLNVTNFSTGANTTLDSTLTTVLRSGALQLLNNRSMTITAGGGAFSNAGFVQLGGGTFNATSFTNNSGVVNGFGTIGVNIVNSGSVTANGGTLATRTITGTSGSVRSNAGAIIDISAGAANSTAGTLALNGGLGLGTRSITVTSNYTNAAFGSGNAFNNHANVTGTGLILAANATMNLSGPALSGGTLNLGNVRTGGLSSTTLTITNNGTLTNLVGAVKNTGAPGVTLTGADWTANAGGGFANVGISFAGTTAGSLVGQTLNVVNNFDNVASQTLNLQGAVYQVANPVINNASSFINVGPVLVGTTVTQALDISNSQVAGAVGFQEGLNAGWGSFTGNAIAGAAGSITNLAAGASNNTSLVLTFDTSTAGSKSGSIAVLLNTNGAGTSGLGIAALPNQNLAVSSTVVTGTVLNPAVATIVTAQPITVAAQRVGGSNAASIVVRNDGVPISAGLDGSFTSATGAVSGSGGFSNLATGSSNGNIQVAVDTTTSGVRTGTATLAFASNLGPNPSVALPSQTVNVTGNVYAPAIAQLNTNNVNFGVVRQGAASPTGSVVVTNAVSGALTDTLITSSSGLPSGVSASTPGPLAAGQSAAATFSLSTATSGVVSGSGSLDFSSHDAQLIDAALSSQSVNFSGTVTQLAVASLFKSSGAGTFAGAGNAYTLNLGSYTTNSGIINDDFGVTNAIPNSVFAELLGGSFTQGAGVGYNFLGNSFTGLAGGQSNIGNLLSFDTTGLSAGTYTKLLTFTGFSQFAGLGNFNLAPISLSISATITGGTGAVPEPASWMMMILGCGFVGGALRRRASTLRRIPA